MSVHVPAGGGTSRESSTAASRGLSLAPSRGESCAPPPANAKAPSQIQHTTSSHLNSRSNSPAFGDDAGWENFEEADETKELWEEDETLSAEDIASINREVSYYEKERRYNILRNQRVLEEMKLGLLAQRAIASEKGAKEGRSGRVGSDRAGVSTQ